MLTVSLFGSLRVTTGDRVLEVGDFPGQKPKQILEALICQRGHLVSKARLAELLWDDAKPRNYAATIETYVSILRRTLDPGTGARRSAIVTEHGGYRFGPAGVEVDLDTFDALVHQAAGAPPPAALASLRQALDLVRGEVLEDEPYAGWAEQLRITYGARHVQTLVDAGRLSLVAGDAPAAMMLAQQAVDINPLAEPAYQVLMAAAYSLWRQDEALAAFDRCRRLLADEIGADPMDETVALHMAILRHESVAQLMPGSGSASVPLTPQRESTRESLPLLARETELAKLHEAAGRARSGKLTLAFVTGSMGVGKSRLVESLAQSLDLPVASTRCSDLESGFSYLPLSLALRSVLDAPAGNDLPAVQQLMERAQRGQPFDQFARLGVMESFATAVGGQPAFLLWLDDAHWADTETLTTLGYLQRRCPSAPILLVLSFDRARQPREALRSLRPDLRIDLGRLPQQSLAGLGENGLFAATGGHPLFVEGWLRARREAMDQPFPPDLCERVITACWDLGPQAYRLLSVASVLPQQWFSAGLLAALVNVPMQDILGELDQLLERDLLIGGRGDDIGFGSPAVRSILAATLSPARRSLVQEQAAAWRSLAAPSSTASGYASHRDESVRPLPATGTNHGSAA